MPYCLAIDIGASSGRHILGEYVNGEIKTEEIYRFDNGIKNIDGTLCWDIEYLTMSVINGIKKCAEIGKIPDTVAIDTWGVDYVLLDKDGNEILPAVSYRDDRTVGIPEEVDKVFSRETLYAKTGIQRANYNTIYQLYCDKKSGKLENAEHLLMMPEYLSYKLTGIMKSEYTISSTTSLLNAKIRNWDFDIINALGIKNTTSKPLISNRYRNARMYYIDDIVPDDNGCFEREKVNLNKIPYGWCARENGKPLVFKLEKCTAISILFERTNSGFGGKATVDANGIQTTLDADFKDGWGIYANYIQVFGSEKATDVLLKIIPCLVEDEHFSVAGIMVS